MVENATELPYDEIMQRISASHYLIILLLAFAPAAAFARGSEMGAALYREYCVVCHGTLGAGDGPVADILRVKPPDLAQLARKSGGKFPELRVLNLIRGEAQVLSHGSREMPIWGQVFLNESGQRPEIVQMRIYAVMKYLEEIQAK